MKPIAFFTAVLLCLLLCGVSLAEPEGTTFEADGIPLSCVFPAGWTVVTPNTVPAHFPLFDAASPQSAAEAMRAEGILAIAFSPEGDATLQVACQPGDETARLYYDIDRYTPAMRTAIQKDFEDKAAWALTGYRFTGGEWTNKEGQGRILWLSYTVRYGEEITARGLRAYTIRSGMAITLDLDVKGRRVTAEEQKLFDRFVASAVFPESTDFPPLPAGLTMTSDIPEETHKAELTVRGDTMPGAMVSVWLQLPEGPPWEGAQAMAGPGGAFRLDIALPQEGEYRVYIVASLEGYADSEVGAWLSYEAKRLPVTLTAYPEGDVYDAQIVIEGKTLAGVTIQCMENGTNKKVVTGSDGKFSFKLDRTLVGERTVVLSMTKDKFDNRRFDFTFNRQWKMEDYARLLSEQTQSLSYANLTEKAERYQGRLVQYTGLVIDVSAAGSRQYVQLATRQTKDGAWQDHIIAFTDTMEADLLPGDLATLVIEVTTDTYAFSTTNEEGIDVPVVLPAVKLLAYVRGA